MSTDHDIWGLWPEGHDRVLLSEVDSTMAEAARRAPGLGTRPLWIVAERQSAGRGRAGRAWASQGGNLFATLIYRPEASVQQASLRSFMAANALFEALALYVDRTRLAQKWPNDVLLDGGKIAGILLESSGTGPKLDWLAIGIGVNLTQAPQIDEAAFAPVSLAGATGTAPDPHRFLSELAGNFATEEAIMKDIGFGHIRRQWLRHAARLGESITARTAQGTFTGTFDSIDEDGNLVLFTGLGPKIIPAADVVF